MSNAINSVWSVLKSFVGFTRHFATVADAKVDKFLRVGQKISIDERGGAVFDVVLASTVVVNTFNIIASTAKTTLALSLQYNDVINVVKWGALDSVDATLSIQHAEATLKSRQTLLFPSETYTISGDYACYFNTAAATYDFRNAVFDYGNNISHAIGFGQATALIGTIFDITIKGSFKLQRTYDKTGTIAATTTLQGIGVRFRNVGDLDSSNCYMTVIGFNTGFLVDSQSGNTTTSKLGKMLAQNCLKDFDFNVGTGLNDYTSAIDVYGAKNVYNRAFFSDHTGSFGVRFSGVNRRCDNVHLFGGTIEAKKDRKFIFDNCEGCDVVENYFDPGGLGAGTVFKKVNIALASAVAASKTITASAHGITAQVGDKIRITSATNSLDVRDFIVVTGSTADTLEVNTPFIGNSTGNLSFTYYGAQIEFTTNARKNSIINGGTLEENIITDKGDRNNLSGSNVGINHGTAEPISMDGNLINIEGLQHLKAAVNGDIYTYLTNAARQGNASVGQMFLGGHVNGYLLKMAAILADVSGKASDATKTALRFFVSANPGGFHEAFSILDDGQIEHKQGATGVERGTVTKFTYQNASAINNTSITLPLGGYGILTASCGVEGGVWLVSADGSVKKISGTINTTDVNAGGNLAVYKNGVNTLIRNFTGLTAQMTVTYNYGQ